MRRLTIVIGFAICGSVLATAGPANAGFPGRNGLIAWTCDSECFEGLGIMVSNPDGTAVRLFVEEGSDPDWSPDGRWLAFTSDNGLEVIAADGSQRRVVLPPLRFDPSWSADGQKLFFSRIVGGQTDIYSVNLDGSGEVQLTNAPGNDGQPESSGDGTVAFASERSGNFDIWSMRTDGSGQTRLTTDPRRELWPDWSPDGRKIAFSRERTSRTGLEDIFTIRADGSHERRLTHSFNWSWAPAWSPDGRRIAYERTEALSLMTAGGIRLRYLDCCGDPVEPDWQPLVDAPLFPLALDAMTHPDVRLPVPADVGFAVDSHGR
jgi:dipeptidyl aminopeptidase/acylaminoacyl peptidase